MDEEAIERGSRAEAETQRRRRRGNEELRPDARLHIPPEVQERLDREGLVPRWVNDDGSGSRIARFTKQDDYEPVEGVDPVPLTPGKDGRQEKAHLLAKRRDFIEEDRANADTRRKAVEASLFRKADDVDAAGKGSNPNPASVQRYVAPESNIGRRNQVLDG